MIEIVVMVMVDTWAENDEDDNDNDTELSGCEWEGWMGDLYRQGYVEQARAESSHNPQTSSRGGSFTPPLSSAPSSQSSVEPLSRTLATTTSVSALVSAATAGRITHLKHHPSSMGGPIP
jgi:hypothetical protein